MKKEIQLLLNKIEREKLSLAKKIEEFGLTHPIVIEQNEEINNLVIQHQKVLLKREAKGLFREIERKKAGLAEKIQLRGLTDPLVIQASEKLDPLICRYQKIANIL